MDVSITIRPQVPAGTSLPFRGGVVPFGFLKEEGQLLQVSAYPRLFEAIGYIYGGAGENFRLPDSRGRMEVGAGQGVGLTLRPLGQTGGEESHLLTVNEMPSHTHTQNSHKHPVKPHTHGISSAPDGGGGSAILWDTSSGSGSVHGSTESFGGETEEVAATNQNEGGGQAHNNMPPFLAATRIIKF